MWPFEARGHEVQVGRQVCSARLYVFVLHRTHFDLNDSVLLWVEYQLPTAGKLVGLVAGELYRPGVPRKSAEASSLQHTVLASVCSLIALVSYFCKSLTVGFQQAIKILRGMLTTVA